MPGLLEASAAEPPNGWVWRMPEGAPVMLTSECE